MKMRYRYRTKKNNHVVIVADFTSESSAKEFKTEMKKTARKMRRLLNKDFSYEIHFNL